MRRSGSTDGALGAYGFRIEGLDVCFDHLLNVPVDWPHVRVEFHRGTAADPRPPGTVVVAEDTAELWLSAGDRIEVSRTPLVVRFITGEPVPTAAILHPFLGLPASIAARWLGRYALHGGAFECGARAWALLGDQGAGKSSTLAYLLSHGHTVLSDDILIVDGETLFAGPRSVDLREDAAELGGEALGFVGNRPRWRIRPRNGVPSMTLAGFVQLEWGHEVRLEPLDPKARLQVLLANSVFHPGESFGISLLELAARPAWRFVRPPGLGELGALTARLVDTLET